MKKILLYAIISFLLIQLIIGFIGISSIIQTFAFYFLVLVHVYIVAVTLVKNPTVKQNTFLFSATIIIGLFITECTLKYGMKYHLSYGEKNGDFFYSSPYESIRLNNFLNKYFLKNKPYDLITNIPYSSHTSNKAEFNYEHTYNHHGLRGDLPENIDSSTLFISLGDSFTEGVGTHTDSTWPMQLTSLLNISCPELNSTNINAGISGNDPISQYIILKFLLSKVSPKYVIIAINSTDIGDIAIKGGKERYHLSSNSLSLKTFIIDYFYGFSFIARTIIHDFMKLNHFFLSSAEYSIKEKQAINYIYDILINDSSLLAKKFNFTLLVVLHPLLYELENNSFPLLHLYNQINKDNKISCINLFEEMHAIEAELYKNYYWPIDQHHNTLGYSLWAKILADKIISKILHQEKCGQKNN